MHWIAANMHSPLWFRRSKHTPMRSVYRLSALDAGHGATEAAAQAASSRFRPRQLARAMRLRHRLTGAPGLGCFRTGTDINSRALISAPGLLV